MSSTTHCVSVVPSAASTLVAVPATYTHVESVPQLLAPPLVRTLHIDEPSQLRRKSKPTASGSATANAAHADRATFLATHAGMVAPTASTQRPTPRVTSDGDEVDDGNDTDDDDDGRAAAAAISRSSAEFAVAVGATESATSGPCHRKLYVPASERLALASRESTLRWMNCMAPAVQLGDAPDALVMFTMRHK